MRPLIIAAVVTLAVAASQAHAASFDCARARAADEKAICANRGLNDADVKMATLLAVDEHLVAMGARGSMQDEQRDWLAQRHTCKGNVKCLTASYSKRLDQLQKSFEGIASRGPF